MMAARGISADRSVNSDVTLDDLLRGGPYDMPREDDCRALWAAVLLETWRMAALPDGLTGRRGGLTGTEMAREIAECRAWFGSADFQRICMFVGFDADAVLAAYRAGVVPVAEVRGRAATGPKLRGEAAPC